MGMQANLLVTRPVWAGQTDPWTQELAEAAERCGVQVVMAPLQRMHRIGPRDEQSLAEQVAQSIGVDQAAPVWLVSTSPAAGQALAQLAALGAALAQYGPRLRLAAIGQASAETLAQTLHQQGVAAVDPAQILTAGAVGDAQALSARMVSHAQTPSLALLLEGADNRPELATALSEAGFGVLRMPVYSRAPEDLPRLPRNQLPWWVLITTSGSAQPAALGLARQNIPLDQVDWIGHHPSIGEAIQAVVPNARWVLVDRLTPSHILEQITNGVTKQ